MTVKKKPGVSAANAARKGTRYRKLDRSKLVRFCYSENKWNALTERFGEAVLRSEMKLCLDRLADKGGRKV